MFAKLLVLALYYGSIKAPTPLALRLVSIVVLLVCNCFFLNCFFFFLNTLGVYFHQLIYTIRMRFLHFPHLDVLHSAFKQAGVTDGAATLTHAQFLAAFVSNPDAFHFRELGHDVMVCFISLQNIACTYAGSMSDGDVSRNIVRSVLIGILNYFLTSKRNLWRRRFSANNSGSMYRDLDLEQVSSHLHNVSNIGYVHLRFNKTHYNIIIQHYCIEDSVDFGHKH